MTAAELVAQGYGGYAGWGDAEAAADFAATGGSGKWDPSVGYGGGADSFLDNAISTISGMVPGSVKPYDEENPFFFDEALAREASTKEYAPYYDEMLSDYVSQVEKTKSRSKEDLARVLDRLSAGKEYYLGNLRRMLDQAVRKVNEGYAGRGLFFAGARERDVKELEEETGAAKEEYLGKYKYQVGTEQLGEQRTFEDVGLAERMYTRDVGREKKEAIEAGVLTRKGEVREEYELSRRKYYESKFPGFYGGL